MRLFVAIELGDEAVAAVTAAVDRLRLQIERSCPGVVVRWVAPASMHLTLFFIGDVAESARPAVAAALAPALPARPFDLSLAGFGAFPAGGPPRIVWTGISSGADALAALHGEVTRRLIPLGYSSDARPFSPHLTVGRVKEARGGEGRRAREIITRTAAPLVFARIDGVTLFRSHLSARGSTYEALMRVPLLG